MSQRAARFIARERGILGRTVVSLRTASVRAAEPQRRSIHPHQGVTPFSTSRVTRMLMLVAPVVDVKPPQQGAGNFGGGRCPQTSSRGTLTVIVSGVGCESLRERVRSSRDDKRVISALARSKGHDRTHSGNYSWRGRNNKYKDHRRSTIRKPRVIEHFGYLFLTC